MAFRVIVIGGVNVDIAGIPSGKLIQRDSNPGKIKLSPGGVGRNIAENLVTLGAEVSLVCAIGDDIYSSIITESCEKIGIDLSLAKKVKGAGSSVYLYIADETGDMYAAVNDMDIVNEINPEFLSGIKFDEYDACVVDANLSRECLEFICSNVTVPLYADPVSCAKAVRLKGLHFTAIKPNLMEGEILAPFEAERVYLSLGKQGIRAISSDEDIAISPDTVLSANTNGAGDAATAAIVFAELSGLDLEHSARFAVKYVSEKLK